MAAGVSGGLGRYFGVDPVLFRVLFATSAFFGGAGLLAYLLAWVAIPDEGTQHAAVDRWIHGLRRRRVPVWAVVIVAAVVLWIAAFSWWAPGPFFPVMIAVIVLVALFGRRGRSVDAPPAGGAPEPVFADPAAPSVPGSTSEPFAAAQTGGAEPGAFTAPIRQPDAGFPPVRRTRRRSGSPNPDRGCKSRGRPRANADGARCQSGWRRSSPWSPP